MKKYLFIFAAAAAVLAGCSKGFETEDPSIKDGKTVEETTEVPDGSFLCSFAMNGEDETKTTINASDDNKWYLIKWEKGDTISVTRTTGGTIDTTATFTAQSSGAEVLFRNKDVTGFFKTGATYTATFGKKKSSSYTVKDGSAAHIYMTATCYEPHRKFVFHTESETAFLAVKIPDILYTSGLKVNGLKVKETGQSDEITLTTNDENITAFYVPVQSGSHRYEICAYSDVSCSQIIAESMKMYSTQTMSADKIYPFTFTPTLKITEAGTYGLKSYPADYKVWITNEAQTATAEGNYITISQALTINYETGAASKPANVYVDAKWSTVDNFTINTPESSVEISNGTSESVISKTSKNTLVVKPTYRITKATVKEGSVTVEGKSDGSRNVDEVVLDYGEYTEKADKMAGVVVKVAKVTTGNPVLITNKTTDSLSKKATPITLVGEDKSNKTNEGGYKIDSDKKQNINPVTSAVAKIGDTVYERLDSAILNVKAGETITLIDDCETGASYDLAENVLALTQPNVTLDLNGYTITETNNFSFVIAGDNDVVKNGKIYSGQNTAKATGYHSYALVIGAIADGSKVTGVQIENVEFKGGISVGGSKSGSDSKCHGSGEATIKGCTVTSGDCYIICSQIASPGSSVTVLSGTYNTVVGKSYSAPFWTDTNCAVLLKGGTYNADPTEWVADGYEAVKSGSESAGYFWTVQPKQNVAKIGNTKYATLAEAFAAANEMSSAAEIVLLKDITMTSANGVEVNGGKDITLDLASHTIAANMQNTGACQIFHINNGGKLTMNDTGGNGKAIFNSSIVGSWPTPNIATNVFTNEGTLIINGGYYENLGQGYCAYVVDSNSNTGDVSLTVNGGRQVAQYCPIRTFLNNSSKTNAVNITGGTFEGRYIAYFQQPSTDLSSPLYCTVSGGTFISKTTYSSAVNMFYFGVMNAAEMNFEITGGQFTTSNTETYFVYPAISYKDNTSLDIKVSGGIFSNSNIVSGPAVIKSGYKIGENSDESTKGDYPYAVVEEPYVAKIGNDYYTSLTDAINAVPSGGEETTVTMLKNVSAAGTFNIPATKNVVLELNGKMIYANDEVKTNFPLFFNTGIFTVQDNTDTQLNGTGTGKLTTKAYDPDMKGVPGYATNTITNYGKLTIKSGLIESASEGSASFAIDCDAENLQGRGASYSNLTKVELSVTGGKIISGASNSIRMYLDTEGNADNIVNVTGGVIDRFWVQDNEKSTSAKGTLTMDGATIINDCLIGYEDYAEHLAVSIKNSTFGRKLHYELDPTKEGNTLEISNISASPFYMNTPAKVLSDGTFTIKGELSLGWVYAKDETEKAAKEAQGIRMEEAAGYTTWFKGYLTEDGQKINITSCAKDGYELVCVDETNGVYKVQAKSN